MARLSVHLVAWNGARYVPHALASLRAQTSHDWELLVIDNASTDDTAKLFEEGLKNFPVPARLIRNATNVGFAKGHNQAVQLSGAPPLTPPRKGGEIDKRFPPLIEGRLGGVGASEYIQLYNQDIYLAPDYIERVVAMMDGRPEAGAGQGLLLRWRFEEMKNEELRMKNEIDGLTEVIDTMGLRVLRNRRVVDWRTGEKFIIHNSAFIIQPVEVFGVSGALPVYRRKAIEEVSFEGQTRPTFTIGKSSVGQVFDEDFFMYKEDVDLAFRLRSAGWSAYVETSARAWHDRTAAGPRERSDRAAFSNRKTKSAFVNYHSYKNHLTVLLKNEHRDNFAKDWPWILWYELKKFVYLLCTDWGTLKGLWEVKKFWPRTMEKRAYVMANYKVKPAGMRRWFIGQDKN